NNPASIPADATSASLTFWHWFDFEAAPIHYYDGGVLELSTDGGTSWADAGSLITSNGYNRTLEAGTTNPLAGRSAWGSSIGNQWLQVQVNLVTYAGRNVLFRLRMGTDASNSGSPLGWWIDDVALTYQASAPCAPVGWIQAAPYPTIMADVAATSFGGQIYSFGGLNQIVNTAAYNYNPI